MTSPFSKTSDRPGQGIITVSVLPPGTPVLQTLSYQYPLKLIAPAAVNIADAAPSLPDVQTPEPKTVHTVFILTYGGGLLPNDHVSLHVSMAPETRLVLLTQGSTKIFKSAVALSDPSPSSTSTVCEGSSQRMMVEIGDGAALCYLPDPVQPFADSAFEQRQTFRLSGKGSGSLCVCDWVCEGRQARGESWSFQRYVSTNDICIDYPKDMIQLQEGELARRLMLRDKMLIDRRSHVDVGFRSKVNSLGVLGTLMLRGSVFARLGQCFLDEFRELPRIGGRVWENGGDQAREPKALERRVRHEKEVEDGLLWTAAASRGNVIVKFGARNVEGARRWLGYMLRQDGTIAREFGERALLCLR